MPGSKKKRVNLNKLIYRTIKNLIKSYVNIRVYKFFPTAFFQKFKETHCLTLKIECSFFLSFLKETNYLTLKIEFSFFLFFFLSFAKYFTEVKIMRAD